MDISKQFNIAKAIEKHEKKQKIYAERRKVSSENMLTYKDSAQAKYSRLFFIAGYTQFVQACSTSVKTFEFLQGLREQKMFLVSETLIRSNRDIIEFHNIHSWCPRCSNMIQTCTCRNVCNIDEEEICRAIHTAIQSLFLQDTLSAVHIKPQKCCTIQSAQNIHTPTCCPSPKMGLGFNIYTKDYHLRPPE